MSLQTPVNQRQTFGYGLFGRSQQPLVEPHRVCAGHFVKTACHVRHVETATQHLGRQQADAAANRAGSEYFEYMRAVVIDCHIKVYAVKRNAPGRALQLDRKSVV